MAVKVWVYSTFYRYSLLFGVLFNAFDYRAYRFTTVLTESGGIIGLHGTSACEKDNPVIIFLCTGNSLLLPYMTFLLFCLVC